ncbi:MAG: ABC transporter permease [Anaerolineales bacterium]|nr:ABC transporter permease [Anaerolineales bacterium]
MMALFRAEWRKIAGNRLLISCLLWVWPFLGCALTGLLTLIFLLNTDARANYINEPIPWTDAALLPWQLLNNIFGRLLLLAFAITVFAGEYEYRTWKTVIPGNRRAQLLLVKYLATGGFVIRFLAIMMVLLLVSIGFMNAIFGASYPPQLTIDSFLHGVQDVVLNATLTFTAALIVTTLAILVSMWTRSILFGLVAGMVISIIESFGIPSLLFIASELLKIDEILDLVIFFPTFNTDNLSSWINSNQPLIYFDATPKVPLLASVLILTVWVVGLGWLSMFVFKRQDIQ